jgi:hypothetical protein
MAKDREGKFHPRKGRPSGEGRSKGFDSHRDAKAIEEQIKLEEKLDVSVAGTPDTMRHPNRNKDKARRRSLTVNTRKKPSRTTRVPSANTTNTPSGIETTIGEVISTMSREEFQKLDQTPGDVLFSFYMPTHSSGVEVNEQHDKIHFKAEVQRLATLLENDNQKSAAKEILLKTTEELISNDQFWRNQAEGLAVFITDNFIRVLKLPYAPMQHSGYNKRFFLRPLLPLVMNKEYFFILLLSKKQAKIFRADQYTISPVEIPELPDGIEDVVHFEEKDGEGLFRTGSSGAGGGANFHGLGESGPDHKENIAMYMKEVDRTLHQFLLGNESAPLVLAGVEYLLSIFRKVSVYGHIWDGQIEGNVEYKDTATLHKAGLETVESYFTGTLTDAIETYGVKSDTSKVSIQPAEIIQAAHYSRVSKLFVEEGLEIWGTFDEKNNTIVMHNQRMEDDESLVDRAIVNTIGHGGEAFILPQDKMPAPSSIAAVMRFDA